jgi:DNA polymerase-1
MKDFINEAMQNGWRFVGHNIISFDVPVLNRLLGVRIPVSRCVDTFVLSMLYSPSIAGGHSLEAWGTRLGFPKTEFNDWSRLSDEMVAYCLNDCRVNVRLFSRLAERMVSVGFSERSCEIEHKAWAIIQRQRKNGFQLDTVKAHVLYAEIRELERQLKEEIYEQWPPELQEVGRYKSAYKKDGGRTAIFLRHSEQYPRVDDLAEGGYCVYDFVEFNLGSPKQRIEKLLELGWEPREFTAKGSPQATKKGNLSPSLEEFLDANPNEAARKLAEWIAINARGNMISTWIDVADEKGLIHGNLWLAGSLRYRHDKPNTANIPAVRVDKDDRPLRGRSGVFTYESRDLWTVRDRANRSLVGVDAKGIQLRILANYINNPKFTEAILSKDPHTANQQSMGLKSRALTKTITYATLMGAGDPRIAAEAKVSLKEAKQAKRLFFEQVPELPALIARLQAELKKTGRITLCSGAKVLVPSDHMVIPYLLQGDESQIMKQAAIWVADKVRREKLDVLKVGDIHDEWQSDVLNDHTGRFIELCHETFPEVGRSFDYNLPIACDAKVGLTWAETH